MFTVTLSLKYPRRSAYKHAHTHTHNYAHTSMHAHTHTLAHSYIADTMSPVIIYSDVSDVHRIKI